MAKGFQYPFTMTEDGPEVAEDEELVAGAMTQLMSQERGERPFQPSNGITLWDYVFENVEDIARADLRRELMLGTTRHEPRATPVRFPVRVQELDSGAWEVEVTVEYEYDGEGYAARRSNRRSATP